MDKARPPTSWNGHASEGDGQTARRRRDVGSQGGGVPRPGLSGREHMSPRHWVLPSLEGVLA